ncbi:daf-6 [Cordylochernes scorpioides]|uniref:Daf-6 n=1 Tax=Cordylochernes scorpioides TaxID=51811 RepID=A0ABY6JZT0_9ARAC|nr:daf-6 [Cordylochernes scorpioides]
MDDTFMLITAWLQTDPKQSVEDRMMESFNHVGVSITITSLTNLIAFVVGTITPFPAIYYFCCYILVSIVICFIFQITLFAGCMALFGRLEEKNRHSIIPWITVVSTTKASDKNWLYRFLFTADLDVEKESSKPEMSWINIFFRDYIGGILTNRWVMGIVLSSYFFYIGFGIYGISRIEEQFKMKLLVRQDSYAFQAFDVYNHVFTEYKFLVELTFNGTADYSDPKIQDEVKDIISQIEAIPYVAEAELTWSWLKSYQNFQNDSRTSVLLSSFNMTTKEGFMRGLKEIFFRFPFGRIFNKDVVFTDDGNDIKTTRYFIIIKTLKSKVQAKDFFLRIQKIKSSSKTFQISAYNQIFYLFEQYTVIKANMFQSVGMATAVVLAVVALLTPSVMSCVCVAVGVLSIEAGVLGFMTFWDIELDVIVMVCLIMCIGLSVDYVSHISCAYVSCTADDSKEKIKHALQYTGFPIIQSCLSTFFGVVVVFFHPSFFFYNTTKDIVLMLIFAVYHSIFIFPIIFHLIDTHGKRTKTLEVTKPPITNGLSA